jgi:hypothetical protein
MLKISMKKTGIPTFNINKLNPQDKFLKDILGKIRVKVNGNLIQKILTKYAKDSKDPKENSKGNSKQI